MKGASTTSSTFVLLVFALTVLSGAFGQTKPAPVRSATSADGTHVYEFFDGEKTWTDARNDAEAYFTRPECTGAGHLVTILDAAEDTLVDDLCDGAYCWIGLSRLSGSDKDTGWVWIPAGTDQPPFLGGFTDWISTEPDGNGLCALVWLGRTQWNDHYCDIPFGYIVEYDDCTPPPASMDDDWDVAFHNAEATFDDTSTTDPEVVIEYNASAPNGDAKYYEQRVLLSDCVTSTADTAVAPAMVRIPDAAYAGNTGLLTTRVDIDTSSIEGSAAFWSRSNPTRGVVSFCVEMELHNEQDRPVAVEYTLVTLQVDTTADFQVIGANFTNELQTFEQDDVRVDYPLNAYFCDDNDDPVTPAPTLFPGDILQVCVKTDSADAFVTDVRSVVFKNTIPDPDLSLEVIDGSGLETNGQTLKACDASTGICNIKSVTFSSLYQLDTNNDGALEDVTAGALMEGTAVLNFGQPSGRHLGEGEHHDRRRLATVTGFDLDLAGNLEQRSTFSSDDNDAVASRKAAAGIGAGIAMIAVAAAAAVALVTISRRRRVKTGIRGQDGTALDETASPTDNNDDGIIMENGMGMI